ncbi:type I methionyl aminopeptidase [Jatrophihabitans endophyticus]|uniref:type I methionyl aminopeptidase n=1 Tax=Jatrophihabitans endophyticus TaxID=1206085 RepID=UPI0019E49C3D|nr:type I methionyl aminopeptidase [Jatrophihabitans endophyticus]MBE7189436.1 type I methionyl aminopeptidase [Jatrophihabitans endophyticus]
MTVGLRLEPGTVSPRREVPKSIARPHYVGTWPGTKADFDDPMVKDADTIARMRIAGRIAADALVEVGKHVAPGVTTDELDAIGHEYLIEHGAYPSTLGYKDYPKSLCTSVNEVICHGIPDSRPLGDGDVVKVDITAFIGGVHGDTCATFYAGNASQGVRELGERTHEAMMRGIRAVKPGRPISVIGRVIESFAKRFGYGVVRDYTGHGVGPSFHTRPTILHYDEPRADTALEPGMTFTIEPMLTLGRVDWFMWDDRWTVLTKDGSWAAQWEHTLVVTDDGAEILTVPSA